MRIPDLSCRSLQPELMDAPGLEPERHTHALRALARINTLSLASRRVWTFVRHLAARGPTPVRVLDVACGGGDIAVAVARRARRLGIPIEVHGCDVSLFALDRARERAARSGVPVHFFPLDVVRSQIPSGYDLVCSSLFLHHLTEAQAEALLRAMAAAGLAGFVQDLVRGRLGWALAVGALRVFTRSRVARIDGERSVRAAFTIPEVEGLARRAGLPNPRITRCWPQRLELTWQAPRGRGP